MTTLSLEEKWNNTLTDLNEAQRRRYLANEAKVLGQGGISRISRATGISRETIHVGIREVESNVTIPEGRVRQIGGGRKKIVDNDATLLKDLDALIVENTAIKGNPMNFVKWTNKAVAKLVEGLQKTGHHIKNTAVYNILKKDQYSMRGNKKDDEGQSPEDRDYQFRHINNKCEAFEREGNPIISIDCKKKEKLGNFKNNGREWKKKGKQYDTKVNAYDFWNMAKGVVAPYGIYDVLRKHGFVNVGITHETAAFAVASIRKWWENFGRTYYPYATGILITADSGGSNAARNRLFKRELQKVVNQIGIPITVAHFPPATSKWNIIEHQLFSFISINWRARPLTSLAVVLELISHTTTKSGLTVTAVPDFTTYETGIKITDREFKQLNIIREQIHGDWNYTVAPQETLSL
jgi:hypothetical protein